MSYEIPEPILNSGLRLVDRSVLQAGVSGTCAATKSATIDDRGNELLVVKKLSEAE